MYFFFIDPGFFFIDPGATHSFVARKIESKLNIQPLKLENRFLISTPLRGYCIYESSIHEY